MAAKLPIVRTAVETYGLVWHRRAALIRLGWPMVAIFLAMGVFGALLRPHSLDSDRAATQTMLGMLVSLVFLLVVLIVTVPFKTSTYRLFLRGPDQRLGYRYRHEEWLYVGAGLRVAGKMILWTLLWLVIIAITEFGVARGMAAFVTLFDLPQWPVVAFQGVIMLSGLLAYAYLGTRYSLVMPAAALDRRIALARSADLLRGNVLRLLAAGVLVFLPFLLVSLIVQLPMLLALYSTIRAGNPVAAMAPPLSAVTIIVQAVSTLVSTAAMVMPSAMVAIVCRALGIDFDQPNSQPT